VCGTSKTHGTPKSTHKIVPSEPRDSFAKAQILWTAGEYQPQNSVLPKFPAGNKSLEYHSERQRTADMGEVTRQGLVRKRPQGQTVWGHMNSRCGRCRNDKPYIPRLRRHRDPAPICSAEMPVRIKRVCPGVWGQSPQRAERSAAPLYLRKQDNCFDFDLVGVDDSTKLRLPIR
jgi:hypothetical protein